MISPYPVICSRKFAETVNFYEDFFGYVPLSEYPDYCVMEHPQTGARLAVVAYTYDGIPMDYRRPVQGMILEFPVADVQGTFDALYMEGVDLITDIEVAIRGIPYFMARDPYNDILIKISNLSLSQELDQKFRSGAQATA